MAEKKINNNDELKTEQKYFVAYTPEEAALVIQSLNRLRNALLRENRDSGCVDELLLKVMCAPVKKI